MSFGFEPCRHLKHIFPSEITQLTINIEDKSILPHLKKILNAIEGVSIETPRKKLKKSGIEKAYEDIRAGRVTHNDNVAELFDAFGI